MKKKIALLSLLALIVIPGLISIGFYAYQQVQPVKTEVSSDYDPTKPLLTLSGSSDKQEAQTTPNLSKDLGACNVVTGDQINALLNIQTTEPANNRGIAHIRGGNAQSCVYSLEKNEIGNNRVIITVTAYDTADAKTLAIQGYSTFTPVGGVGDGGYFVSSKNEASETTPASNVYHVMIFKGKQSIDFTLAVPADTTTLDDDTARAALSALAKQAALPN